MRTANFTAHGCFRFGLHQRELVNASWSTSDCAQDELLSSDIGHSFSTATTTTSKKAILESPVSAAELDSTYNIPSVGGSISAGMSSVATGTPVSVKFVFLFVSIVLYASSSTSAPDCLETMWQWNQRLLRQIGRVDDAVVEFFMSTWSRLEYRALPVGSLSFQLNGYGVTVWFAFLWCRELYIRGADSRLDLILFSRCARRSWHGPFSCT